MTKRFHTYKPSNLDHKYAFSLEEKGGMVHMHLVDALTGDRAASVLAVCSDGTLGRYSNYNPRLRRAMEQSGLLIDSAGRIKLSDERPTLKAVEDTQAVFHCASGMGDTLTVEPRPLGGVCILFDPCPIGDTARGGTVYLRAADAVNLYQRIGSMLSEQGVDL